MSIPDIQHALELLEQGKASEAIPLLERLIDLLPRYVTPYVLLARAYEANRQWQRALAVWQQAHFLLPNSPSVASGVQRVRGKVSDSQGPIVLPPRAQAATPPPRVQWQEEVDEGVAPGAEWEEGPEAAGRKWQDLPEEDEASVASPDVMWQEASEASRGVEWDEASGASPDVEWEEDEAPGVPPGVRWQDSPAEGEASGASPDVEWEEDEEQEASPTVQWQEAPSEEVAQGGHWEQTRGEDESEAGDEEEAVDLTAYEGEEDGMDDLDRLIGELESARIIPRPDVDYVPPPDLDDEIEDVVSETLARIYASQQQFDEAARVYELLAARQPERADEYQEKAAVMRARASDD